MSGEVPSLEKAPSTPPKETKRPRLTSTEEDQVHKDTAEKEEKTPAKVRTSLGLPGNTDSTSLRPELLLPFRLSCTSALQEATTVLADEAHRCRADKAFHALRNSLQTGPS